MTCSFSDFPDRTKPQIDHQISSTEFDIVAAAVKWLDPSMVNVYYDKCLGKGAHSHVCLAEFEGMEEMVCVKLFLQTSVNNTKPTKWCILKEAFLMSILNGTGATPHCYGVVLLKGSSEYHEVAIVLERIKFGENLSPLPFANFQYLPWSELKEFWSDLCKKLEECLNTVHNKKVTHGDLHGGNIILGSDGPDQFRPVMIDFGLGNFRPNEAKFKEDKIAFDQLIQLVKEEAKKIQYLSEIGMWG